MSYIKKVAIKNYRFFKEMHEFNLAPITILTGPNNSGKSSFSKFLQYVSFSSKNNGLLKLEENNPFFANWESVIPYNTDDRNVTFYLGSYKFCNEELDVYITINNQCVSKIEIINHNESIVTASYTDKSQNNIQVEINLKFLIEKLKEAKKKEQNPNVFHEKLGELKKKKIDINTLTFNPIEDFENRKSVQTFFYNSLPSTKNFELKEEIDLSIFENLIHEVFLQKNVITPKFLNFNLPVDIYSPESWKEFHIINAFNNIESQIKKELKNEKLKYFDENEYNLAKEINPNIKIFKEPFEDYIKYFFEESKNMISKLSSNYPSINKLRTDYYFKDKIVPKTKLPGFEKIYKNYNQAGSPIKKFVNSQIKNLEIADSLEIREVENVAYVFELIKDGQPYSFADIGSGYSQIISIILSLAEVSFDSIYTEANSPFYINKVVLIEEPEVTLHPNLQSKIADIIAKAVNTFSIQFIIETHSEYLIRKLQFLVAQKNLQPKDIVLYYFYGQKERETEGTAVNKIKIKSDGILSDPFGKGFFDEATNLQLDLIKINSIQAN